MKSVVLAGLGKLEIKEIPVPSIEKSTLVLLKVSAVAVFRYGADRLRLGELINDPSDWKLSRWWNIVLTGFVSIGAEILLRWRLV